MLRHLALASLLVVTAACSGSSSNMDGGVQSTCTAPSGSGTMHSAYLTASETWTAAGSPHIVTQDIKIPKGLTLTVEPCAELKLSKGVHLIIEGNMVAEGLADKRISIAAADASQPFAHLGVWAPGTLKLAYATVMNGGSDMSNSFGIIEARGDQYAAAQEILKVDHVTVKGAQMYGVSLRAGGAFTKDSAALEVSGSTIAPVRILPRLLTNLPTGTYTGNTLDAIVVETEAYGDVTLEDVTIHDRGVPYIVGKDYSVGAFVVGGTTTTSVTLTIEPGVVMKFKKDEGARLIFDKGSNARAANATLKAVGTADKHIVFTSVASSPAPGDWMGLSFGNIPTGNQLEFVEVRYAGGPSRANGFHCMPNGSLSPNEDAAISVWGNQGTAFVTNSIISDSAGVGINLAYQGATVDFTPTNTFTNIAGCKQSTPRPVSGLCPAAGSCP